MSVPINISSHATSTESHPFNCDEKNFGKRQVAPQQSSLDSLRDRKDTHEQSIPAYIQDEKLIRYISENHLERYLMSTIERVELFFSSKPSLKLDTDLETGRCIVSVMLNSSLDAESEFDQLTLMFQGWSLIHDQSYNTHFYIS